jgi:hypothetical protein
LNGRITEEIQFFGRCIERGIHFKNEYLLLFEDWNV